MRLATTDDKARKSTYFGEKLTLLGVYHHFKLASVHCDKSTKKILAGVRQNTKNTKKYTKIPKSTQKCKKYWMYQILSNTQVNALTPPFPTFGCKHLRSHCTAAGGAIHLYSPWHSPHFG